MPLFYNLAAGLPEQLRIVGNQLSSTWLLSQRLPPHTERHFSSGVKPAVRISNNVSLQASCLIRFESCKDLVSMDGTESWQSAYEVRNNYLCEGAVFNLD